jgi:hypothetical protein
MNTGKEGSALDLDRGGGSIGRRHLSKVVKPYTWNKCISLHINNTLTKSIEQNKNRLPLLKKAILYK